MTLSFIVFILITAALTSLQVTWNVSYDKHNNALKPFTWYACQLAHAQMMVLKPEALAEVPIELKEEQIEKVTLSGRTEERESRRQRKTDRKEIFSCI